MTYQRARQVLPRWLLRHIYHFESVIADEVQRFSAGLPDGARVLDAGAGESRHAAVFPRQRYTGIDLAVGDPSWNYRRLDALADLERLPFSSHCFDAALMIVTIEHLKRPGAALAEIARVLRQGARLLVVAPHQWEVHQAPHDYFRYTRYGLEFLLSEAGFEVTALEPAGGLFRLLSRRLLAGVTLMPIWLKPAALLAFLPMAVILPLFDRFDARRDYTLGYSCMATKR
ncbi:MAG TPA: class I SAM-dependent methyltransferase [Bryobacteraceae bacterium]|nr:class I SAM-dependent methyltransferase [Bryobacteraceae bacterium]